MGYKNVYRFSRGIDAWKGMDYSIASEKKNVVLVFLRAPEKGRVKTRLAREIGDEKTLALYKKLVQKTLTAVEKSGMDYQICFFPADKKALVQDWLGADHAYMPQQGKDLGQRMGNALSRAFDQGAQKAVLVGTDIPDISAHQFLLAQNLLGQNDVVIGPSMDGGYWLIGFRRDRFNPGLFRQVDWGTDSVFSTTIEKCKLAGLSTGFLPTLQDIDTLEDIQSYNNFRFD